MTAMLLLFVFMGAFGGYASARLYKSFRGEDWKLTTLRTALSFPGFVSAIFMVLNFLVWGVKSSGALPFGTLVALIFLWFGISVPLCFVGSYFGYKQAAPEVRRGAGGCGVRRAGAGGRGGGKEEGGAGVCHESMPPRVPDGDESCLQARPRPSPCPRPNMRFPHDVGDDSEQNKRRKTTSPSPRPTPHTRPQDPVRTNKIPRQIPDQPWYMNPLFSILIGGILPFGAVFIELFFILTSMWLHQFYYLFGFLALVTAILVVTCCEITIVLCYFQLCSGERAGVSVAGGGGGGVQKVG
jgi:hypothetical protein